MTHDPHNVAIAKRNGGLLDLRSGEFIRDGEGERAQFISYGDLAPIYVNLKYRDIAKPVRLPNAELRRA